MKEEARIQANVIEWWQRVYRSLGVADPRLLYHVPNGAYFGGGVKTLRSGKTVPLGAIRFAQLKRQGFVQGVPDLVLAVCRMPGGRFCGGLYLELKRPQGGRVSDAQRDLHPLLRAEGYCVEVAKSFEEAVEIITRYALAPRVPKNP